MVLKIILTNPDAIIWFAGDLNLPNINWNLNCLQGNNYPSTLCMKFSDTLLELRLSQIVTFPTRQQNTLDIFITNHPTLVRSCDSIPVISVHEAVCVLSNIVAKVHKPTPRKIMLWNKANFTLIEGIICDFNNEFQLSYDPSIPVSTLWDKFKNLCMKCLDLIPVKQTSSNSIYPWILPVIKRLSRQKQRWYNKATLQRHGYITVHSKWNVKNSAA